ncbi:MAG TPA: c-type cytochrome biogenesis protein CcsB [Micromonosporaceae bacterium]|nr:c-type cytochrome biogenesis protein CcsB [Micromonosporaceae bacterium]
MLDLISNNLLVAAILLYLVAMLCYAVEYAFGSDSAVARVAERAPALVGAGAPISSQDRPDVGDGAVSAAQRRARLAGLAGVVSTVLAAVAHGGTLVTRGFAADRVPWGNMYEFVVATCFVGTVAWLVVLAYRPALRHLGLFLALIQLIMLGVAGMSLYAAAGPLVPALNSYWLKIHVGTISAASGILLVGFVAAALTLIRTGYDEGKVSFPYSLGNRLPAAEGLERLTFRVHAFAFPLYTFAVICGAIWAEAAWGRYWGWDPKETWSFIAWVVYACYLHARATPSIKRSTATWIAVAGWGVMQINLYGVNLVISGLHSYAGVN